MGHKIDVVSYWNKTGRKYDPKSKQVRKWMLNSKNHELEFASTNRSKGVKVTEQYKPPVKKKKESLYLNKRYGNRR